MKRITKKCNNAKIFSIDSKMVTVKKYIVLNAISIENLKTLKYHIFSEKR